MSCGYTNDVVNFSKPTNLVSGGYTDDEIDACLSGKVNLTNVNQSIAGDLTINGNLFTCKYSKILMIGSLKFSRHFLPFMIGLGNVNALVAQVLNGSLVEYHHKVRARLSPPRVGDEE